MLRKILAVCAALMLVLSACGDRETAAGGMLSRDEIERMESLYLTDRETALEGLGFSKKDLDGGDRSATSAGAYLLNEGRSIGGRIYRQIMLTSIDTPEGLYGMAFQASFDSQEEAEDARDALRDVIKELYGEPVYPGTERWIVGELTELSLHFFGSDDYSEDEEYYYMLTLEYSTPSVVDGKRLTGDELTEMVRSVQERRK